MDLPNQLTNIWSVSQSSDWHFLLWLEAIWSSFKQNPSQKTLVWKTLQKKLNSRILMQQRCRGGTIFFLSFDYDQPLWKRYKAKKKIHAFKKNCCVGWWIYITVDKNLSQVYLMYQGMIHHLRVCWWGLPVSIDKPEDPPANP